MAIQLISDIVATVSSPADTDLMLIENASAHKKMTYLDLKNDLNPVAGANTQIQFNNAGAFGGASTFIWDGALHIGTSGGKETKISTASYEVINTSGIGVVVLASIAEKGYFDLLDETGLSFARFNDGDSHFTGGNFGIGTTTPGHKLHIKGASGDRIRYEGDGSISTDLMVLASGSDPFSSGGGVLTNTFLTLGSTQVASGYINFFTRDGGAVYNEKMRITNAGNVGIGTTSPTIKLDVKADVVGYQGGIRASDTTGVTGVYMFSDTTKGYLYVGSTGAKELVINNGGGVSMLSLPTSNPGGTGKLWNNSGVLNIT